jgi:hypothetical protein
MNHVIVIMLILALESPCAQRDPEAPNFSIYSQSESFRYHLRSQTDAAAHLRDSNLMAISAFPSGDRFALRYVVTESGQEVDYREVYNWASQASHRRQLSEIELGSLRAALKELPLESESPPIERLVIVSFREGDNWVTRSYDSAMLPNPMQRIYDIIGERFESTRR